MTTKAELIRDRDNYLEWYNSANEGARKTEQARYEDARKHHQTILKIIAVLGFGDKYPEYAEDADGNYVEGVTRFLADVESASVAIESAEAKRRLGIK